MEFKDKKCANKNHSNLDAISFCPQCKKYWCHKCDISHSDMYSDHISYKLNQNLKNIFTGICEKKNHHNELLYFCKTHNELCCPSCISKVKREGFGQHSECSIANIEEIADEKKNNLKVNLKCLEDLSRTIHASIDKLNNLFKTIDKNKEELKMLVQKIFTTIICYLFLIFVTSNRQNIIKVTILNI